MRVKGKRGWVDSDGFDQGPGRRLDTTIKCPMLPEPDFFRASIKRKVGLGSIPSRLSVSPFPSLAIEGTYLWLM